ncbi:MAG: type 1 glutamine amidotransferase [Planctomycetota bacterium]|jgi:type 1 glutamine amidotransferase
MFPIHSRSFGSGTVLRELGAAVFLCASTSLEIMMKNLLPLVAALLCTPFARGQEAPTELGQAMSEAAPRRVLFLTHSAGFTHSVVRRPAPDQLAHAEREFVKASKGRLEVTPTQNCDDINAANLANYDAVLFYTTGELPISDQGRSDLMDWIRAGGAFTGSHCATDTLYKYTPYVELIGGMFDGHPWHQEVTVRVEAPSHPSVAHLGSGFKISDEIYQFRSFERHPLHVLLSLDPESVQLNRGKRRDADYALAWCKEFGEGRMFYTALGHREEVWQDKRFLEHLMGGIEWAIDGPDYSPPPPAGAKVLFDGVDSSQWRSQQGTDAPWKVVDAALEVTGGTGNQVTKQELGSGLFHLEFLVPETPKTNGWQDRGNSGIYVQGRYEVQVLDSHGLELRSGDCGGIYGKHVANVNACRKAGRWQAYDIRFTAPVIDDTGEKTANARMSVWHNGIRIHDDVEVDSPTAAAMKGKESALGPLMLQDHGHPVRYRNIWFVASE